MAIQGVRAEIDLTEVEKLAAMQATDQEMAAFFGVTTRTIERRRHEPEFVEAIERGKAKGRLSNSSGTVAAAGGRQYSHGDLFGKELFEPNRPGYGSVGSLFDRTHWANKSRSCFVTSKVSKCMNSSPRCKYNWTGG